MLALPMLLYHRVCADDAWQPSEFVVTATVFREQMRFLARTNCYTPRLSEVLGWNGRAPRSPRTPVLLTFDDGYLDNLEIALPILQELGFTAAVFPVLDLGRRSNWWDAAPALRAPLLTPENMRSMEAAGLEFGSHTMSHPHLTLASDAELGHELTRSREVLASIVRRPLPVLAYPYGEVDARVKRAVAQAGYSAGLAVNSGPVAFDADPFEIRRLVVGNHASDTYLRVKLSGAEKVYRWLRWKAREGLHSTKNWRRSRRAPAAA